MSKKLILANSLWNAFLWILLPNNVFPTNSARFFRRVGEQIKMRKLQVKTKKIFRRRNAWSRAAITPLVAGRLVTAVFRKLITVRKNFCTWTTIQLNKKSFWSHLSYSQQYQKTREETLSENLPGKNLEKNISNLFHSRFKLFFSHSNRFDSCQVVFWSRKVICLSFTYV